MMKQILTAGLLIVLPFLAHSQRSTNLELTMVDPVNNLSFVEGNAFYVNAIVKNLGPDTIHLPDEIKLQLLLDGFPMLVNGGTGPDSFMRFHRTLVPNDTMMVSSPPTFTNFTGLHSFCLKVSLGINSADPLTDSDLTNNDRCAAIHIIPLAVSDVPGKGVISAFPIPATSVLNWKEGANEEKQLTLTDLTGRIVFRELTSEKEGRINVSGLPGGVYLLTIRNAENRSLARKIVVE